MQPPPVPAVIVERRQSVIRRRIVAEGFVETRRLAEEFNVDASTIRRDLDGLARAGLIQRTHGGALAMPGAEVDLPYTARLHSAQAQKRAIARHAARLVADGSSLVLDSGSTTYEIARALTGRRGLTVATNDVRIAHLLARTGGVRLLVTGGQLMESVYALVGPVVVDSLAGLRVDWAFLGADAVDAGAGVTNRNTIEVPIKRAMLAAAARAVLVADSAKFGRRALASVCALDVFSALVTDDGLNLDSAIAYGPHLVRVSVTGSPEWPDGDRPTSGAAAVTR